MKIVIAGAGEVGTHLAKMLSKENQDITLLDSDQSRLDVIDSNYNLMTWNGSTSSFESLKDVGVGDADLYIAVTPYETRNITSCAIAKKLGASKTVASFSFRKTNRCSVSWAWISLYIRRISPPMR